MPAGIPVATVAINGAKNAGLLAARVIGAFDKNVQEKVTQYQKSLEKEVLEKAESLEDLGFANYLEKVKNK